MLFLAVLAADRVGVAVDANGDLRHRAILLRLCSGRRPVERRAQLRDQRVEALGDFGQRGGGIGQRGAGRAARAAMRSSAASSRSAAASASPARVRHAWLPLLPCPVMQDPDSRDILRQKARNTREGQAWRRDLP